MLGFLRFQLLKAYVVYVCPTGFTTEHTWASVGAKTHFAVVVLMADLQTTLQTLSFSFETYKTCIQQKPKTQFALN